MRALIGRNPCLDQAIQTRKFKGKLLFYKTITLWLPCLDGLIQTRGNAARVKKNARNHEPKASDFVAWFWEWELLRKAREIHEPKASDFARFS
jgi:hypothetical protein